MVVDGIFDIYDSKILDVMKTKNSIILKCTYMSFEYAYLTFYTDGEDTDADKLIGRIISYITVVEEGYEIHFTDEREAVRIKAHSYVITWE